MKRNRILIFAAFLASVVLLNLAASAFFFRWDLTSEKKYSISPQTKKMLRGLDKELTFTVFLDGDLNAGFLRLKKSTEEMLDEFKIYGRRKIHYSFSDPVSAASENERAAAFQALAEKGAFPIEVNENGADGKTVRKVIFPYAQVVCGADTLMVNLLKKVPGKTGYENLNISVENLEFELTDAIRTLTAHEAAKVAFLEGHGELPEIFTYDISRSLSRYFQVDRGVLASDATVLDGYKVVVVASPQEKFSESDKYILDQYIMNGGRVLWLVDGASVSMDTLAAYSVSPALPNDVNLNDQLFRYGVRVNYDLLQDAQCQLVLGSRGQSGESSVNEYQPSAWYFAPLLQPLPSHPVSRNLNLVKADFASSVDFVGTNHDIRRSVLLTTSGNSRALPAPLRVGLEILDTPVEELGLNAANIPVAVALEGTFPSVFKNRLAPKEITRDVSAKRDESLPTRMIVVSDGDIIRNDVVGTHGNARPMPLGFDRNTGLTYGNLAFLTNAVLYLADDEGWFSLRSRDLKLRMLDKVFVAKHKTHLQVLNVALPVLALLAFAVAAFWLRRRRYAK